MWMRRRWTGSTRTSKKTATTRYRLARCSTIDPTVRTAGQRNRGGPARSPIIFRKIAKSSAKKSARATSLFALHRTRMPTCRTMPTRTDGWPSMRSRRWAAWPGASSHSFLRSVFSSRTCRSMHRGNTGTCIRRIPSSCRIITDKNRRAPRRKQCTTQASCAPTTACRGVVR